MKTAQVKYAGIILLVLLAVTVVAKINWRGDIAKSNDSAVEDSTPMGEIILPPELDTFVLEGEVFELVNREREKNGLNTLEWSDEIADVARRHSLDMALNDYFDHLDPDGNNVFDRMEIEGLNYNIVGENIYKISEINRTKITYFANEELSRKNTYKEAKDMVEEVVVGWLKSRDHKSNLLNIEFQTSGIGIVKHEHWYFVTQNFAG
jgi:uncharacterized protein YkwD